MKCFLTEFFKRPISLTLWIAFSASLVFGQAETDSMKSKLTMNFKDADILNVLRLLSKQNNLNLVASKDVKGRVTVHFSEVSLEDALETIL